MADWLMNDILGVKNDPADIQGFGQHVSEGLGSKMADIYARMGLDPLTGQPMKPPPSQAPARAVPPAPPPQGIPGAPAPQTLDLSMTSLTGQPTYHQPPAPPPPGLESFPGPVQSAPRMAVVGGGNPRPYPNPFQGR